MVTGITNIEGIESFTKQIILHYMDRSNGGDNLAPPRPPKLLPRVHRPRAPEPVIMNETTTVVAPLSTITATAAVSSTLRTPQCTSTTTQQLIRNNNNKNKSRSSNNNNQQTHQNSIKNTSTHIAAAATAATRTLPVNTNTNNIHIQPNIISNINSKNNNNIEVSTLLSTSPPSSSIALQSEDYQIHHLTFLPQRATPNLNRNGSHVSTSSSSASTSLITATNSFTRRRPQSPLISVAPLAQPVVTTITGNSSSSSSTNNSNSNNNNNNNNNFLSHFHSVEPVPTSPVTLAQPRPESERLVNEYVDTPLRNAHQLQHASRIQHPAGQHDNGQTTTHHLLLLPQRELRQQQQQQQQHIYPSNRLAATAGSVNATTGIDGTDGFLHSHNQQYQHNPSHNKMSAHTPSKGLGMASAKVTTNFHTSPITQPITKQPATSINQSTCKFAKELPALDELLDFHNIATGITTAQGMVSAVSGASPLGPPIIFGSGGEGPSSLSPITCPRCERCRCEQCQSPRPLPQTWICNKTCLCSAESIIDYASCLCCAKALFYHCARDNDMDCDDGSSTPCVDNPCSCGPYKRTQRWGWLGALSLVLPCLWCYWPMRGCATLCEKCYGRFAKRGCRCQQIGSTSSMLPIASPHNVMGRASTIHANSNVTSKSVTHHSHHNDCTNGANRILRKGDPTPEKRLLDTTPEY